MNYRHAYHAGNFADVLKHAVLALIITYFKQKPAPFRVIDTHAGPGVYRLDGEEAAKTGEWRDGIGRVLADPPEGAVAECLGPYLTAIGDLNASAAAGQALAYPGSPLIIARLLRYDDQLIANELHPDDGAMLRRTLGGHGNAKVLTLDGWMTLKAVLPPKERRGIVLIDPPFEQPGEFERLSAALQEGLRRFATGTYMLWYPMKDRAAAYRLQRSVNDSTAASAGGRTLTITIERAAGVTAPGLNATGLSIVNPPFTLASDCALIMPYLARVLQKDRAVTWEIKEAGAGSRA